MRCSCIALAMISTFFFVISIGYGAETHPIPLPSFHYEGHLMTPETLTVTELSGSESNDIVFRERTCTTPDGKLQILIHSKSYKHFPVVEWSVELKNLSPREATGLVSDFHSLETTIPSSSGGPVRLHHLVGSLCNPNDFSPQTVTLAPNTDHVYQSTCGRSSNDFVPFLELDISETSGFIFALGWTGTWKAVFSNQGKQISVSAGMNETRFKLMPGETIRQPSIVLFRRSDLSRREFKTVIHRFMIDHKSPRDAQGKVIPPILALTAGGGNKTPEMLLKVLDWSRRNQLPFDTYWIDAGWNGTPHQDEHFSNCGPNWSKYVGNWQINTQTHPTGDLLPIANAVHQSGMKFLLWFEPERIRANAPILKTHPEYRMDDLLRLDDPEAFHWIQNTIYEIIDKHNIDIYRQDFNINPGPIWKKIDGQTSDRVGITEAKYIAALYRYMDEMRVRFPGILQENCASGGRRLDIEMIMRAHSYCRSDYFIDKKPGETAINLGQNATLNLLPYLPFQGGESNGVLLFDDYAMMSFVSSGTVFTPTDFNGGIIRREFSKEETQWFKKTISLAERMRPFYLGDFFPLTDETGPTDHVWCGWQLDRADLGAGFILVFRRTQAAEATKSFLPGHIEPKAKYELELFDGSKKIIPGSELANLKIDLAPRSFFLAFYKKMSEK